MKRIILAWILVLSLLAGLSVTAFAAPANAALTLDTKNGLDGITVTLSLRDAKGVSNGRVSLSYDPQVLSLKQSRAVLQCGTASLNTKEAGEVSFAWVGSSLPAGKTGILELTFRFTEKAGRNAVLKAEARDVYASGTKCKVASADTTLVYNPYTDINGHWAKDEILKATHAGIFQGMTKTTYAPEENLTRAMFVTVLHRIAGTPASGSVKLTFRDVPSNAYYARALAWAYGNGIVTGRSQTEFSPDDSITRQELVTMLFRFAKWQGRDVSSGAPISVFKDSGAIAPWAERSISWAVDEGILNGYTDGTIQPNGNATRAEAAAIVCRYAGL